MVTLAPSTSAVLSHSNAGSSIRSICRIAGLLRRMMT
jgi:hypothetical protein